MTVIRIDTHTHTVASSHAFSTISENAASAAEAGLELIACTDHGPGLEDGASRIYFKNMRCVPRFISGVAILRGIEANIDDKGHLDCSPAMREGLDIVMAGFHAPVYSRDQGPGVNTEVLRRVMASGVVDVITHPANMRYPVKLRRLAQAAKQHNVALEINASVYTRRDSFDMAWHLAKMAYEVGAPLVMGSDAHICFDVGKFDLGYEILKAAQVDPEYLINSSPARLLEFLEKRGHGGLEEFKARFGSRS